jgi:uncharacterized protein (TIRG00374 family)
VNLGRVFAVLARAVLPLRRFRIARPMARTLLQARRAADRLLTGDRLLALAGLSLVKWGCNLTGIVLVMLAFADDLTVLQAASVAIVYNLAAVIPLQTIGGIGMGEVSLAAGLAWYGYGVSAAAAVALLLRLVLIAAPVLFWGLVVGAAAAASGARRAARPTVVN